MSKIVGLLKASTVTTGIKWACITCMTNTVYMDIKVELPIRALYNAFLVFLPVYSKTAPLFIPSIGTSIRV
ncbi:MAG: hypothetical protein CM15mV62_130 [uncultured marine virus]|nr:MAG: hypothetical protein CM15mV62_130 [uncultured marine virus]